MTQLITGELFKKMINNAAAAIDNNKQEINELNVFPVPDGDTGTNMRLTVGAAEKALAEMTPGTLGYTTEVTAGAMLRGARGNSGVILSLLFRGFAKRLKDVDSADAAAFAGALATGVDSAYKAVMKPSEGTILTVSRLSAASAVAQAELDEDIETVLEKALETGHIALAETINQNPVLKKAGVIDAGAKGYIYILDGMLKAMRGIVIEKTAPEADATEKADFSQFTAEDIKFAYCTEFLIERKSLSELNRMRDFLDVRGDSIVVVDDEQVIKVHIHTNDPGAVLTEALKFGSLHSIKIDNMRDQHTETIIESGPEKAEADLPAARPATEATEPEEYKEIGTVVVCAGSGIEEVFRDLGADRLVPGGQTMNPSTEDILEKIIETPSETVIVLPNNKNIIMAAEQCIPLTSKKVVVIPTKSVPQGIAAMLSMGEAVGIDEIAGCMTDAAKRVRTALVTLAVRDSVFDGQDIKEGEYLALLENILASSGCDAGAVIDDVAEALGDLSPDFITIFAGEDAPAEETALVEDQIRAMIPDAEVTVIQGGQPVYRYIISAE